MVIRTPNLQTHARRAINNMLFMEAVAIMRKYLTFIDRAFRLAVGLNLENTSLKTIFH